MEDLEATVALAPIEAMYTHTQGVKVTNGEQFVESLYWLGYADILAALLPSLKPELQCQNVYELLDHLVSYIWKTEKE